MSITAEIGSCVNGGSSPVTLSHRQGYSVHDNAATQSINSFVSTALLSSALYSSISSGKMWPFFLAVQRVIFD